MKREKLYPGRKYKHLVLLKFLGNKKWLCKFNCGHEAIVATCNLDKQKACSRQCSIDNDDWKQKRKKEILDKCKIENGCWRWYGSINKFGYGNSSFRCKRMLAHRLSWFLFNSEIPYGLDVCHKCDVRDCVNPNHLFLGTASDNVKDAFNKGRIRRDGKNHPGCKIDQETIEKIFDMRNKGLMQIKIAELLGLHQTSVSKILRNKHWIQLR